MWNFPSSDRRWRLVQDGCKDGLGLIDDFQASFHRAEALLFCVVPDVLKAIPQLVGLLPHNPAQGSGGKLSDHLLFPWGDRPKVSDYPMVGAVRKLMKEDGLVL